MALVPDEPQESIIQRARRLFIFIFHIFTLFISSFFYFFNFFNFFKFLDNFTEIFLLKRSSYKFLMKFLEVMLFSVKMMEKVEKVVKEKKELKKNQILNFLFMNILLQKMELTIL